MVQALDDENPFTFCNKEKECGHLCKGVKGESECLPCLNEDCIQVALDKYDEYMALPVLSRKGSSVPKDAVSITKETTKDGKKPPCVF